jgi:hypothetical protein
VVGVTRLHACPDCECVIGEAFAPRPATSSPGVRRTVLEQTAAEVRRAKEQRIAEAKAAERTAP